MRRSCITIDRQYGNGEREVGRILSQKLEIPFYDSELLLMAAEKYGLNPGALKDKDEKRTGSLLHDMAVFAGSPQNYGQLFEPFEMFGAVSETIRRLAMDGPGTDPAYPLYGSLRHVPPVTFCKGLFNQVHPQFTFQGKKIRPGTCF